MQTYSLSQMRRFVEAMGTVFSGGTPLIDLLMAAPPSNTEPLFTDFTLADFSTYAALPFTGPTSAYNQPDGTAEMDFGDLSWILSADPATGNTILGYVVSYLVSAVRTPIYWEALPPTPMMKAGDAVVLSVPLTFFTPGTATLIG